MTPKQINKYDVIGENVALVDISTPSHPHAEMLINLDRWLELLEVGIGRVFCHKDERKNTGYAVVRVAGKSRRIHRLLLPDSIMVDHKNRNGLDNRECNISPSSPSANGKNKGLPSNNKSGTIGVHWHKRRKKWVAQIAVAGKTKHLGIYEDVDSAVTAREEAGIKYGYTN